MSHLYEIAQEHRWILELLQEPSADPESIRQALDAIDGQFKDKVHVLVRVYREMESREKARREEAKRLPTRADVAANAAQSVKDYLQYCMRTAGLKKVETDTHTVIRKGNGGKQALKVHAANVPGEYPKREEVAQPDTDKSRTQIEAGHIFDWATVHDRGEHITIS